MKKHLLFLLKLSRPRFWLYLAGPFAVGYVAGIQSLVDFAKGEFVFWLVFFLLPANIFLYGINDYFDEDTDKFNDKKGDKEVLVNTKQRQWVKSIITIIFLLSFPLSIVLPPVAAGVFLIFLFLGSFYSAPPIRFKARPGLDALSNVLYIMPGIMGYFLANQTLPSLSIFIAGASWSAAMHLFSAIPDIESDKQAGLKTTAVTVGFFWSLMLCFIFWSISAGLMLYNNWLGNLSWVGVIYLLIPIFVWQSKNQKIINKVYWLFPYVNAIVGATCFWWLLIRFF